MRLEQWGAGKEHYRMASEYPELVLGRVVLQAVTVKRNGKNT